MPLSARAAMRRSSYKAPAGSQTFNYVGVAESFVVPFGHTQLTVDLYGAEGGGVADAQANAYGGYGGRCQCVIAVTPGETLTIEVGQMPAYATNVAAPGGWPNGGQGNVQNGSGYWAAGGGGSTAIKRGTTPLAVAGGGGGVRYGTGQGRTGGAGGGTTGVDGGGTTAVGGGGTQTAGGDSGITNYNEVYSGASSSGATAGSYMQGGNGGTGSGGGGGGYYGGGGGGAWIAGVTTGAGGGGSGFSSGSSVTLTQGVRAGNGVATISWS